MTGLVKQLQQLTGHGEPTSHEAMPVMAPVRHSFNDGGRCIEPCHAKPFLNIKVKRIQTAFIVDRGHHTFPIAADFVGYVMATSLQEHVEVNLSSKDMGVYLS